MTVLTGLAKNSFVRIAGIVPENQLRHEREWLSTRLATSENAGPHQPAAMRKQPQAACRESRLEGLGGGAILLEPIVGLPDRLLSSCRQWCQPVRYAFRARSSKAAWQARPAVRSREVAGSWGR
jgi:hypothetical protein